MLATEGGEVIRVISTGLNAPTKARCKASVEAQKGPEWQHTYVEAGGQHPPKPAVENFYEVTQDCQPGDVIVMLDGDDWLAHDRVLARIAKEYEDPDVWMTYGSFVFADGRPGSAAPVVGPPRAAPFTATHLKTFRAKLFHHADIEHSTLAWDLAVMFPLLELAGTHARFIPDVLYTYNLSSSFEWSASNADRQLEAEAALAIRSRPSYQPLDRL